MFTASNCECLCCVNSELETKNKKNEKLTRNTGFKVNHFGVEDAFCSASLNYRCYCCRMGNYKSE